MKQVTLLLIVAFGYATCDVSQYLPPRQQSRFNNHQQASNQVSAKYQNLNQYQSQDQYQSQNQYQQQVPILRLDNNNNGDGTYNYAVETGDGIRIQEQGDATGEGTKVQGGFSYTAPDGQQIQLQYSADENGFQAQGEHLPTPHPIPEEIQRAIEQNLAEEARGVYDDGQYRQDQQEVNQKYSYPTQQSQNLQNQKYSSSVALSRQYVPPARTRNY